MTTLSDALRPRKPVAHPESAGYDRVHGNEMTLMERRLAPLTWMTPYYRPESMVVLPEARVLDRIPLRMGDKMKELRSEEMTRFGSRKYKEARPLQVEYTDRIREVFEAEQREAEQNKTEFRKRRWWHRQADITLRDPVKALRYNNLFIVPSELMNAKDIVTLQLTGCRVGDEAMSWVSSFFKQTYTLRRVCLQGNNITASGCKDLVDGIRNCKTLTELDISLNPIGDDGCSAICTALLDSGHGKASRVYSVNMSTCQLTSSSGHALARLVRESKVVQSLCLWRNQLGELIPGERSGALRILDELVVNPHTLRILDLTANGLADQDLSEHCRMLEANLRKNRLQDIEKKKVIERITRNRKLLVEKRANAVWEDEKIEVKRIEKEVAADMARVETFRRFEDRNQTREARLDERFLSDVQRHTGGLEINTNTRRIRFVINGNFSIQPTTIARLKEYYDVSPIQNIDVFVNMPRRHDNLINYRRRIGDAYETRDYEAHDEHDIFKWDNDKYSPDDQHRRRVAMQEYRAEQQRKKEAAKRVHFDKFKLNLHGTEEDLRTKQAHVGVSVASGVNARVKETLDDDVANGTGAYGEAQQAKLRGALGDVADRTTETVIKRKVELDPIVIVEKASDVGAMHVKQHKDKDGNVTVEVTGGEQGATAMAPEEVANMQAALQGHDATKDGAATVLMRTHIELNETHRREGEGEGATSATDGAADDADGDAPPPPQVSASDNFVPTGAFGRTPTTPDAASLPRTPRGMVDEAAAQEVQRSARDSHARIEARQQEIRSHLSRKSVAGAASTVGNPFNNSGTSAPGTPRGVRTPRFTLVGRESVVSNSSNADNGGNPLGSEAVRRGTYIPAEMPNALLKSMRKSVIGRPPSAVTGTPAPEDAAFADFSPALLTATAADSAAVPMVEDRLLACMAMMYEGWAEVRHRAEVGSPSDAELEMLAKAEANVAGLKKALVAALVGAGGPFSDSLPIALTSEEHIETAATFIEDVVKETDGPAGNVELLDALLLRTFAAAGGGEGLNIPAIINERGLVGIAACDGSEAFFARLLGLATSREGMDAMEIFCSCYYNGISRIQLTHTLVKALGGGEEGHPALGPILAGDEGLREELATITQEFFEDVASDKKAISRENRTGKIAMLEAFLDSAVLGPMISLEHENGNDRQTIVSRALFEGDMPLLKMLLGTPRHKARITNPNLVKSDQLSLLMMAVIGNNADAVDYFLSAFGTAVDVNLSVKSDVGAAGATALDMALNLGRSPKVIEVLRSHGASMIGDQIAKGTVANGKLTVSVTTKEK